MKDIIKYVVECDSLYGVISLAIMFLGLVILGYIVYKCIIFILPYIYKCICKICNTITKYKDIRTKANGEKVSFEAELHQYQGLSGFSDSPFFIKKDLSLRTTRVYTLLRS